MITLSPSHGSDILHDPGGRSPQDYSGVTGSIGPTIGSIGPTIGSTGLTITLFGLHSVTAQHLSLRVAPLGLA